MCVFSPQHHHCDVPASEEHKMKDFLTKIKECCRKQYSSLKSEIQDTWKDSSLTAYEQYYIYVLLFCITFNINLFCIKYI